MENDILETSWLYYICNSKTIKIYQNQHADFQHAFLFTEDSLKIRKGLKLVSRPYFSFLFFFLIKIFLLWYDMNLPTFITKLSLLSKLFSNILIVSSLEIWWRHENNNSGTLKLGSLKCNKKSICPSFKIFSFTIKKQNSKN